MPFNTQARKEKAAKQQRDERGYFISKEPQIKIKSKTTGAGNLISKLFKAEETQDDEALVNVKVHNPLVKIVRILEEIKSKQATTFSMKFTIPLLALPIFFFLAFQLGRADVTCQKYHTSIIGQIKNIVVVSEENPNIFIGILKHIPYLGITPKEITQVQPLIMKGNEAIVIINNSKKDLNFLDGRNVILTGKYSSCQKIITLENEQNILPY